MALRILVDSRGTSGDALIAEGGEIYCRKITPV
jgi:hypothetical protein